MLEYEITIGIYENEGFAGNRTWNTWSTVNLEWVFLEQYGFINIAHACSVYTDLFDSAQHSLIGFDGLSKCLKEVWSVQHSLLGIDDQKKVQGSVKCSCKCFVLSPQISSQCEACLYLPVFACILGSPATFNPTPHTALYPPLSIVERSNATCLCAFFFFPVLFISPSLWTSKIVTESNSLSCLCRLFSGIRKLIWHNF